jgi:hypothetical protein
MFRALPRSNMSTGFRINHQQQNYPQPMSGVSHPVARTLAPTRNNWNQYPPRNNRAEANMHESQLSDQNYHDYENYDYLFIYLFIRSTNNCLHHILHE